MNRANRGAPASSAKRLPWAPARTERPDLEDGSIWRSALCFPGFTGNSMTVATESCRGEGVPMEQAASSRRATSASKNDPRLIPVRRRTSSPTSHPKVTPW